MSSSIRPADRVMRSLFVALAVGLGWGIRGSFGHLLGAMFPGACLGLGFAYVSGQKQAFRWMPVMGAASALAISLGGRMSYGLLHGYAKADTFVNFTYGFFTLFLQGGAWGIFGGAAIGLLLERKRIQGREWAAFFLVPILAGLALYFLVYRAIGFDVNPYRSNAMTGFTGASVALFATFAYFKRWHALKGAMFGYIGFGLGMSVGRLLGNATYHLPWAINNWNVMETGCGFIGGFIFTFGMLGRRFEEAPRTRAFGVLSAAAMAYVTFGIPLLHRLRRMPAGAQMAKWTKVLEGYGYDNPETAAGQAMLVVYAVLLLAALGTAFWAAIHYKERTRWAAYPLLLLCFVMLIIQETKALYFWYPSKDGIDMQNVYYLIVALMLAYVLFYRQEERVLPDDETGRVPWRTWIAVAAAGFCLTLLASGVINGEKTMSSACTRFPLWSWRDGPPPGRE